MCKPGEPCNEAGDKAAKPTNTQAFFGRLELLIVLAELHEAQAVEMPDVAITLLDAIGPLLMDNARKAKGWDGLQLAKAIIQQKRKLFEQNGVKAPANPFEELVEMLAEVMGGAKAREKNGMKPA